MLGFEYRCHSLRLVALPSISGRPVPRFGGGADNFLCLRFLRRLLVGFASLLSGLRDEIPPLDNNASKSSIDIDSPLVAFRLASLISA